ncbi:MAG TPA: DoxX family membrane protein [Afipia sp.]
MPVSWAAFIRGVRPRLLTFPFWGSGLSKLIDFSGGTAEMAGFGLKPAVLFNAFVLVTQLLGSAAIILNR